VLDAECLECRVIRPPGDFQFVLVLECPECSDSLRPHPTVNRDLGAIGIECRLDTFDELVVGHRLRRRRDRWRSRLRRRCSHRRRRRRRRRGGGLALTR